MTDLKDNFNRNVEIDENGQNSHAGKPKNKAEQIRIINNKFDDVLLGITPKGKLVMNIAVPSRDFGISNGFDEITILKLMVINYHEIVSNIMTDKHHEKLAEPINLANLLSMKG